MRIPARILIFHISSASSNEEYDILRSHSWSLSCLGLRSSRFSARFIVRKAKYSSNLRKYPRIKYTPRLWRWPTSASRLFNSASWPGTILWRWRINTIFFPASEPGCRNRVARLIRSKMEIKPVDLNAQTVARPNDPTIVFTLSFD